MTSRAVLEFRPIDSRPLFLMTRYAGPMHGLHVAHGSGEICRRLVHTSPTGVLLVAFQTPLGALGSLRLTGGMALNATLILRKDPLEFIRFRHHRLVTIVIEYLRGLHHVSMASRTSSGLVTW